MTLNWKKTGDWLVRRQHVSCRALTVVFAGAEPTLSELASLRRISSELGALPVAELKRRVGETGSFKLGELNAIEAPRIKEAAQREGLVVLQEILDRIDLLPIDRASGTAWLIEDPDENRRICLAMVEAGCPVQDEYVD